MWKGDIRLFDRQIRPAEKLLHQRSILLYHSPGSGKTYASLYAVDRLTKQLQEEGEGTIIPNVIVIAPAKVIAEVWRPTISKLPLSNIFTLTSYEMARSRLSSILSSMEESRKILGMKYIVICDEVHVVRNIHTKGFHAIFAIASKAYKLILLTGTPIINSIEDTVSLARLLHNDARITFRSSTFIDMMTMQVINLKKFTDIFRGLIDHYKLILSEEDYPQKIKVVKTVDMYPLQKIRYGDFISQFLSSTLKQLMEDGIISNALNPFLVRTRAISNTVGKFKIEGEEDKYQESEKFLGIRKAILEGPKPAVIYSFFLSNGVIPMKTFLDLTTSLKTVIITGQTKEKDITRTIYDYSRGRIDVLLITSTVRQGISLPGTRQLHVMEPLWNESMSEQIDGRVVRYKSHSHLPKEDRNVRIFMWITHYNNKMTSSDEYIYDLAERKQKVISVFERALDQQSSP